MQGWEQEQCGVYQEDCWRWQEDEGDSKREVGRSKKRRVIARGKGDGARRGDRDQEERKKNQEELTRIKTKMMRDQARKDIIK